MINFRTVYCTCIVALLLFCWGDGLAQGTSNKGTEFWTLYMDHIRPPSGGGGNMGPSSMILYITSDLSTTGTVDVADGSFTENFSVTANAVTMVNIPAGAFVGSQGQFLKGIHIKSLKPIAVYGHIYASSVSGATLLLPVSALGKDYMSINYKQLSNAEVQEGAAYSTMAIIATEDNTSVEITPSEQLLNGEPKGVTFTVNLKKGEVYQALSNTDLTGTRIKSVSSAAGSCKRIAVFSGSSKIGIGCSAPAQLTSDNLFQQVYATTTWGKNYVTAPLKSRPYDVYRIILSDPATQVTLNGAVIPANQFTNNLYYEFSSTTTNFVSADKPVQVVQYAVTQGQGPNCTRVQGDVGDPEMIYLSPIEQGLDKVTLYSTGYYNIISSYINVVIPTSAVNSFTLDGAPYTSFITVPGRPEYSYAQISVSSGPSANRGGSVTSGTHTLKADKPFNAIAYGFGSTESYGYAAGTNQVDLNTHLVFTDVANDTKTLTAACSGSAYKLQLTLPYQTTRISWDLDNGSPAMLQTNPIAKSTSTVAGKTLYNYEYPGSVIYPQGNYVATATVFNPVADDCGSDQEVQFFFESTAKPVSAIDAPVNNCLGDIVQFKDASVLADGSYAKSWLWNFGDNTTSTEQNPKHTYTAPGDYTITLIVVDNNGCSSVTSTRTVHISKLPVASFNATGFDCVGNSVSFTSTSVSADGNIVSWKWDFNDGTPVEEYATAATFGHTFTIAKDYNVKLLITTDKGCTATYQKLITIHPLPVVDFTLPDACLDDVAKFNDLSTIADHTEAEFTYAWNFGDSNSSAANNTSNLKNAQHKYSASGIYTVTLTVTSKYNCKTVIQKQFTVNGATPKAKFEVLNNCSGSDIVFKDLSAPSFGNITKLTWYFDYDNHPEISETFNSSAMHADGLYNHSYGLFNTPASKTFHVKLIAYSGDSQSCTNVFDDNIVINANPTITLVYNNAPITSDIVLCSDNGDITIHEDKGIYQGSGTFTGTGITSAGKFDPSLSGTGTFNIKYVFTADGTACTYTTNFNIVVNPIPVIQDDEQYGMLEGQTLLLKPNVSISSGTLKYSWSPDATLSDATIAKPYASPKEDITYTLTVTSDKGCTAVKSFFVKVLKTPLIPNAFTPNNDGINDRWEIKYLDMYPNVKVDIFSRSGEKVFSSRGYGIPWDGTRGGGNLPMGTYYYIIDPGSGRKTTSGYVSIIK
ncbi:PKD domain-containing protein [Mucilaginibacter auburnensis]|uniref:Gliding motility-associated-like protein n=1 Tax=Mucilaginibacter auburnensis TaxID=1457233 RepID=A0A2H9VMS5_9SPHI|nr:PKD domain-containing protein [Mucilaginibacter auburnensis]PJJ79638.1 gliding motility-associated-like protein [Mucilaginibacter auburnensis]